MKHEITVPATLEKLEEVNKYIVAILDEVECPPKAKMQIEIAVEEIFVNIANYAYKPVIGNATVRLMVHENPLSVDIQFLDEGVPYNPLLKEDPDITLGADEREIGGLGIFMTKKTMDRISYSYDEGKNVLTISKKIEKNQEENR